MQFHPALPSADVPEGASVPAEVEGQMLVLCRSEGVVYALENRCTHAGSKLSGGRVRDGWIACPVHGARFDLASGVCRSKAQNYAPVPAFETREVNGMIEVRLG